MDQNTLLSKLSLDATLAEARKIHEDIKRAVESATTSAELEAIRDRITAGLDEYRGKLHEALFPPQLWGYMDYLIRKYRRSERRNIKMTDKDA